MEGKDNSYYIGVDVGTGSARACIIDSQGIIIGLASKDISKWEPKEDYFNQSSNEIWNNIGFCIKKILKDTGVDKNLVKGIGFDATCSLVVLNEKTNEPMSVGPKWDNNDQNILLWMDHRAVKETNEINATNHKVLKYVGGKMSIEMEIPKIKWLKNNMPNDLFKHCKFYDLADFLTHRATDKETRSYCSTVCKQGFLPIGVDGSEDGWSKDFLQEINLNELIEDNYRRLGGSNSKKLNSGTFLSAGQFVGYLTDKSAQELGLHTNVAVGSGVIDAYAGWIGTVGSKSHLLKTLEYKGNFDSIEHTFNRLASVAGTSTCHLVMSKEPVFVNGVWGPYRDVLIPGFWLAEGGQSATGELLKFVLSTHPAYNTLINIANEKKISTFDVLNNRLKEMKIEKNAPNIPYIGRYLFFYGDLYGNRSPIAEPRMRGDIIGINLGTDLDNLAYRYYGAIEFIAQQTRHIIETLNKSGHQINSIFLSGGQCRNELLTWLIASATNMPLVIPKYIDAAVVLGSAFLGAKAASIDKDGNSKHLWRIMSDYSQEGKVITPTDDPLIREILDAKFKVFLDQTTRQVRYRASIDEALKGLID